MTLSNEHDVVYGLRKLVDIAERSIASSPFNDPTTAVPAIDRLHDCLPPLEREGELLRAAATDRYADDRDVRAAATPDRQGIGPGPEVVIHR